MSLNKITVNAVNVFRITGLYLDFLKVNYNNQYIS